MAKKPTRAQRTMSAPKMPPKPATPKSYGSPLAVKGTNRAAAKAFDLFGSYYDEAKQAKGNKAKMTQDIRNNVRKYDQTKNAEKMAAKNAEKLSKDAARKAVKAAAPKPTSAMSGSGRPTGGGGGGGGGGGMGASSLTRKPRP